MMHAATAATTAAHQVRARLLACRAAVCCALRTGPSRVTGARSRAGRLTVRLALQEAALASVPRAQVASRAARDREVAALTARLKALSLRKLLAYAEEAGVEEDKLDGLVEWTTLEYRRQVIALIVERQVPPVDAPPAVATLQPGRRECPDCGEALHAHPSECLVCAHCSQRHGTGYNDLEHCPLRYRTWTKYKDAFEGREVHERNCCCGLQCGQHSGNSFMIERSDASAGSGERDALCVSLRIDPVGFRSSLRDRSARRQEPQAAEVETDRRGSTIGTGHGAAAHAPKRQRSELGPLLHPASTAVWNADAALFAVCEEPTEARWAWGSGHFSQDQVRKTSNRKGVVLVLNAVCDIDIETTRNMLRSRLRTDKCVPLPVDEGVAVREKLQCVARACTPSGVDGYEVERAADERSAEAGPRPRVQCTPYGRAALIVQVGDILDTLSEQFGGVVRSAVGSAIREHDSAFGAHVRDASAAGLRSTVLSLLDVLISSHLSVLSALSRSERAVHCRDLKAKIQESGIMKVAGLDDIRCLFPPERDLLHQRIDEATPEFGTGQPGDGRLLQVEKNKFTGQPVVTYRDLTRLLEMHLSFRSVQYAMMLKQGPSRPSFGVCILNEALGFP